MTTHIEQQLTTIAAQLSALSAHLGVGASKPAASGASADASQVADDADLDSQYGSPEVRIPKSEKWAKWTHLTGKAMHECPADFLREYARLLEWQAGKDEAENKTTSSGKPTAPYKRRDAARARGWAKRNAGAPPQVHAPAQADDTGDLPF